MIRQPNYYGLVRQVGPGHETPMDKFLGQTPYEYTPNHQSYQPYTMPVGSPFLSEKYSTKGLIYDAATSPVIISQGKKVRGKIVRAKKVVLVDNNGDIVNPTDSYFLNKYMGEMKKNNQQAVYRSAVGASSDLSIHEGGIQSVKDDTSMASGQSSKISADSPPEVAEAVEELGDLSLGMDMGSQQVMVEPIVDRGAQRKGNAPMPSSRYTRS